MRCFLLIVSFALIFAAVNCVELKKEEVEEASKEVYKLHFDIWIFSPYLFQPTYWNLFCLCSVLLATWVDTIPTTTINTIQIVTQTTSTSLATNHSQAINSIQAISIIRAITTIQVIIITQVANILRMAVSTLITAAIHIMEAIIIVQAIILPAHHQKVRLIRISEKFFPFCWFQNNFSTWGYIDLTEHKGHHHYQYPGMYRSGVKPTDARKLGRSQNIVLDLSSQQIQH